MNRSSSRNSVAVIFDDRRRADLYRPTDEPGFAGAFLQLVAQGLTKRDIAQHLRLDPGVVRRLFSHQQLEDRR